MRVASCGDEGGCEGAGGCGGARPCRGLDGVCAAGLLLGYPVVYDTRGGGEGGNCLGGVELRVLQLRVGWPLSGTGADSSAINAVGRHATIGFSVPEACVEDAALASAVLAWETHARGLAEQCNEEGAWASVSVGRGVVMEKVAL